MSLAGRLTDYSDKKSIGSRLRGRRMKLLMPIIHAVFEKYGQVNVIDIGGTRDHWNIISDADMDAYHMHVTLANLYESSVVKDDPHFACVAADGCNMAAYQDNAFHIAYSNSVIEHVGGWNEMVQLGNEIKRVAENYFVQTPNFWFPVEVHCMTPLIHWLPQPMRIWLTRHFKLGHWPRAKNMDTAMRLVEGTRLLNKPMLAAIFDDAEIYTERLLLLPKSHIAIRNCCHYNDKR